MTNGAGALLARSGLVHDQQLKRAREARAIHGGTIGEHLVLFGHTDDERLTSFYHSRLMVPRVDPNKLARIPKRVIAKIPADMATEFRLIPVSLDRDQNLTVVMSDPSDTHALDEIGFFTGLYVMRAVATQRQIAWCLAHYYGYVSPLGETLLEAQSVDDDDGEGAAASYNEEEDDDEPAEVELFAEPAAPTEEVSDAVPERRRGPGPITREVEAQRHRVRPPPADTGPVERARAIADEPPTGPMIKRRRPKQEPNPPELASRAGEVEVRGEAEATPRSVAQALPAVVVDVAVAEDPIAAIEETDEDEVVILDRPRAASAPDEIEAIPEERLEEEVSEVVVLDTPKPAVTRRRRTSKRTRLGLGIVPAANKGSAGAPETTDTRAGEPDTAPAIPSLVVNDTDDTDDADDTDTRDDAEASDASDAAREASDASDAISAPTHVDADADQTDGVPVEVSDGFASEANPTSRYSRVDYDEGGWDEDADEIAVFGPPGTTIPPAFLGAMPDTEQTGPQNAIPLDVPGDESGAVAAEVERPADPVAAMAGDLSEISDTQRELESASIRLVETLRALDNAMTRDAIVEALVDHLAKSFARATFFVVRGQALIPFRSKGAGPVAANWKNAKMKMATASTFRDVVQARLPFRGRLPDEASQAFAAKVFGVVPEEILLVPCSVRERPVGVVCGTGRTGRIFHEHLSVVTRGAGDAFERLIKARKGTES